MPSAADLPSFELVPMETPTFANVLGAKGVGESGTIGAIPAVYNANMRILQSAGFVAITYELIHDTRVIPLAASANFLFNALATYPRDVATAAASGANSVAGRRPEPS